MVALPLTVLAVLAATGHPRTGEGAVVVGLLLIGWILVQVLFLRELSPTVRGRLIHRAGSSGST